MHTIHAETLTGIRPPVQSRFEIAGHDSAIRVSLESRVRSGFGQHFDACIEGFMPELAVYRHFSGATGVIGLRDAAAETLYLEAYLSRPVDTCIASLTRQPVYRGTVVEVGQFVVDDREIVPEFFKDLVPFLRKRGFEWVCFTGTNRIRSLLSRVGFSGYPLATADKAQVSSADDTWGSYYDFEPEVIVGKLDDPTGRWLEAVE